MKRGLFVLGATVLYWVLMATSVLARGGGGRGGSFAAPRSGGGLSGGLSGGGLSGGSIGGGFIGGGFSGGFFPFPLFFGGGGGGLITLAFLAVIAYGVLRVIIRRTYYRSSNYRYDVPPHQNPKRYSEPGLPVDLEGRLIKNERGRFGAAINFTRQNMDYFAKKFPRWDYGVLTGRVKQVFFFLQEAWSRQDLSEGSDYLVPEVLADYRAKLEGMKARGERNVIRDPDLSAENIDFVYSQLDIGGERFVARVFASLYDYTVDAAGRVVSGEEDNRLYFTEFWEFVWQDNKWKLAAIYQEDSLEVARWARVDEL